MDSNYSVFRRSCGLTASENRSTNQSADARVRTRGRCSLDPMSDHAICIGWLNVNVWTHAATRAAGSVPVVNGQQPGWVSCSSPKFEFWLSFWLCLVWFSFIALAVGISTSSERDFIAASLLRLWTRRRLARERKRCFSSSSEDGSCKR